MRRRAPYIFVIWLISCIAVLGVTRTVIALPEQCGNLTTTQIDNAIEEGVSWFERNQQANGTWLYRFNINTGVDEGGYNWVRHAGVLLSLEQVARYVAGDVGVRAAQVSERGWNAITEKYRNVDIDGVRTIAMISSSSPTGGTALTGIALSERRLRSNKNAIDNTLLRMGRFVAAQVQDNGSVLNDVDTATGVGTHGSFSPFATGQTMFLLARVREITKTTEFDDEIASIIKYLSTERAKNEGYVPDVSDHWGAYGMAVLANSAPEFLSDSTTVEFIRKQLGIAGIQVRYESQRTNDGLNRYSRGRQTLGAGLGTLGEAIGAWQEVVENQEVLREQQPWLHERLYCVAELLVQRQVSESQAQKLPDASAAQGSWAQFGFTQMDDQQHAVSALLAARRVNLDAPNVPRRTPVPEEALLVVLAAIALLNPGRLLQRGASCSGIQMTFIGTAVLVGVTALGGPVLRALNVSAATALVAAGAICLVTAIVSVLMQLRKPKHEFDSDLDYVLNGLLRPEVLLTSIAMGAGGQGWTWSITLALVAASVMFVPPQWKQQQVLSVVWLTRLLMIVAIFVGVAMIVDGVYAV